MSNALSFRNIESDVTAIRLSSDSSGEIGKILGKEAGLQLLSNLTAKFSEADGCHLFTYRYRDETTDSTLNPGDYLVKLNTGKYLARSAADFESEFIHTENDVLPAKPLNVVDNFVAIMSKKYIDLSISGREDCLERMNLVVEKLRDWYTTKANILTLDFSNYSMISPTDIHLILEPFGKATYMKKNTQIILNFDNNIQSGNTIAARATREIERSKINSFNLVGLQELVGELKLVSRDVRSRITAASFVGNLGAPSAVASSVTEGQWLDIIDDLRNLTGIARNSAVTR